jgi:hypothetical protein
VPEKIAHDCVGCAQFRHCGQYAVSLSLRAGSGLRLEAAAPPARAVAAPRSSVERLPTHPDPGMTVPVRVDCRRRRQRVGAGRLSAAGIACGIKSRATRISR